VQSLGVSLRSQTEHLLAAGRLSWPGNSDTPLGDRQSASLEEEQRLARFYQLYERPGNATELRTHHCRPYLDPSVKPVGVRAALARTPLEFGTPAGPSDHDRLLFIPLKATTRAKTFQVDNGPGCKEGLV